MSSAPVLDTHAWVWWVVGDTRLGRTTIEALDALPVQTRPYVADISLWEVALLVQRGRLELTEPLEPWLEAAAHPRSVRLLPITPAVADEVAQLPETLVRDPADRLIVSTCRALNLPLLSHDRRILQSRLVRPWKIQ